MIDKVLGLIGLSQKSGNVVSGEFSVETTVKEGKARLVLIATDASDNTKKKFRNMAEYRHIPYVEYGTKETLGHAMGRAERSSAAVTDQGFAKAIMKILDGGNVNG